jgi:hypothetical protein
MFYPREAEKDHLYNRIVLLTVACCVLLLLASLAKHSGTIYGAVQWGAVEVKGTVTQLESIPMNENGMIIHYRYTDSDQQVHEDNYADQRYNEHHQLEVGGTFRCSTHAGFLESAASPPSFIRIALASSSWLAGYC